MNVAVVYESMFGSSREIAEAIAEGIAPFAAVTIANVNDPQSRLDAASASLLVLGGPTHVHGMSRPASRAEARVWSENPAKKLRLEEQAEGFGVREWLEAAATVPWLSAAFDTRMDVARILSGAASGHIATVLSRLGSRSVSAPESFLVGKDSTLENGERDRAVEWGATVIKAALQELAERSHVGT